MKKTLAGKSSCAEIREITKGRVEIEGSIKYSVVIPLFNEEENICPLYVKIVEAMGTVDERYEIIFIDDGSVDRTYLLLAEICDHDTRVSVIRLRKNFGQTAALQAGFDFARGDVIISLDGDLQHDPAEIPRLIAKLQEGYDVVSGWRVRRTDAWITRKFPSRIANWMMARFSGVPIHDFGTTFKAYRREVIQDIRLYSGHHRFIPALASWSGATVAEVPIKNIPRKNGKSNYGLSRVPKVLLDLISIKFLLDYSTKPLQLFGLFGLLSTGFGMMITSLLLFQKMVLHEAIMLQHGPLLFMAMLLILSGLQFLSAGLIGEMVARTYYESQCKATYAVREMKARRGNPEDTEGSEPEAIAMPDGDTGAFPDLDGKNPDPREGGCLQAAQSRLATD